MAHKRLFVTKDGDMGLAYEGISKGDVLTLLLGSKTPSVLRKVPRTQHRGEWRFVAQCYLDGWMRWGEHEDRGWKEGEVVKFILYCSSLTCDGMATREGIHRGIDFHVRPMATPSST